MKSSKMKNLVIAVGIIIISIAIPLAFLVKAPKSEIQSIPGYKGFGLKPNAEWFEAQRAYPYSAPDINALRRAREYVLDYRKKHVSDLLSPNWELCGPYNIGGRITDLEMEIDGSLYVLAGTASGGIFKSTDEGASWYPVFDDQAALSIGDIAISRSNPKIVYAGTGEPNAGGGSITYDGNGIYKSIDGGESWLHLGLDRSGSIARILVHPDNPDIVYAAAMGRLFEKNPERGVYKSTDGGKNWESILSISDSTGCIDLAINYKDPEIIYASMWERVRTLESLNYGGATSNIYRSDDGGKNWNCLTAEFADDHRGRIAMALSEQNPELIYAAFSKPDGRFTAMYQSTNSGEDWALLPHQPPGAFSSYFWWFGKIFINPFNDQDIFVCGLPMLRRQGAVADWGEVDPYMHVDQHALAIHPSRIDLMMIGNDGGIYISKSIDTPNLVHVENLPITQFYTCETDNSVTPHIYGGTQDNGVIRRQSGKESLWEILIFADGFYTKIDRRNPNIIYGAIQYGYLLKSTDNGKNFYDAIDGIDGTEKRNWKTPFVIDPTDQNVLYYGTTNMYRSTDGAVTWRKISNNMTRSMPTIGYYGTITSISVSPVNNKIIWAGTDDANVQVNTGKDYEWAITNQTLPQRWVTCVYADRFDEETAYVTFSGYRFNDNASHVYKTTNLGKDWTNISGNLPDVPVNCIVQDPLSPKDLYVATDVGVFHTSDFGESWEPFGTGIPIVPVLDLNIHEKSRTIYAATYGRSMYCTELNETGVHSRDRSAAASVLIYPQPAYKELNIRYYSDLPSVASIDIYNLYGCLVRNICKSDGSGGISELVWDLRDNNRVPVSAGTYIIRVKTKSGELTGSAIISY
jgi:photosystem II stability/assembly factor-like uncharacterized protein